VRLWKSMKPRVYENPHEGGTRDPRRDHVRIPKEIVLIPEPPFTFAAHSAPFCFGNPNSYNAPRSRCGAKSGLAALGNGKTARESARQIPACSSLSQEPKACWRSGSADPTAPEQVWQAPGLREFRLAESQQILPPTGNRKPASDRTHWIQPVQCSRRRSCPGGERGDRQSSVPADPQKPVGVWLL